MQEKELEISRGLVGDETGKANHYFVAVEVTLDSAVRNDETLPFEATWMDLENLTLSEVRQKSQEPYDLTHMQAIKLKAANEQKDKQKLTNSTVVTRGKEGGGE